MARILGVDIPGEKRVDIALRYIYGIGPVNARSILEKAKLIRAFGPRAWTNSNFRRLFTPFRRESM